MAPSIPRLLHYVFLTPPGSTQVATLSAAYSFWLSSCARVNPEFTLTLWTSADCDRLASTSEHGDWYARNLSRLGTIRQADFCRLLVLERFGGVYVDFDVLCLRPLEPLLRLPLFAADEPDEHKARWGRRKSSLFPCNAVMGSQPRHPFWRLEMQTFRSRCSSWDRRHGYRSDAAGGGKAAPVMTGPHLMAPVWRQYVAAARKQPQLVQPDVVLVPTATFYPVPAAVERARAFDVPRDYPNETLVAHQWGSFYTTGRLHRLGQRPMPVPPFVRRPFEALSFGK